MLSQKYPTFPSVVVITIGEPMTAKPTSGLRICHESDVSVNCARYLCVPPNPNDPFVPPTILLVDVLWFRRLRSKADFHYGCFWRMGREAL